MTIKPRTIDNLGIEASNDYAKRQQELDSRLVEESKFFPANIEPGIIAPYMPTTETMEEISLAPVKTWATFEAPDNFAILSSRLFSYQFIPSLGSTEDLQSLSDKLDEMEKSIPADSTRQYEYKTCRNLVSLLIQSFRTFDLIKSRCNQYQRG